MNETTIGTYSETVGKLSATANFVARRGIGVTGFVFGVRLLDRAADVYSDHPVTIGAAIVIVFMVGLPFALTYRERRTREV